MAANEWQEARGTRKVETNLGYRDTVLTAYCDVASTRPVLGETYNTSLSTNTGLAPTTTGLAWTPEIVQIGEEFKATPSKTALRLRFRAAFAETS